MEFPVVPFLTSVGLAGADGFVASYDQNQGNHSLTTRWATRLQGAAVAVGLVGEFARWPWEITEPLLTVGAALFTRQMAFQLAQGTASTVTAQGYRAYVRQPQAVAPLALPYGQVQQPTRAGYAQPSTRVA